MSEVNSTIKNLKLNEDADIPTDIKRSINIDGKKIGNALIRDYHDGERFLTDFIINPEFRGKGYGQKALKILIDKDGVNSLTVAVDNEPAKHIYDKFGFKVVGTHYFDKNSNEEVYYMKLNP